jgi:hypothetical protein
MLRIVRLECQRSTQAAPNSMATTIHKGSCNEVAKIPPVKPLRSINDKCLCCFVDLELWEQQYDSIFFYAYVVFVVQHYVRGFNKFKRK